MASICCSPPDSEPASWLRRSRRSGNSANISSTRDAKRGPSPRANAPIFRFSWTVSVEKSCRPSGTQATPSWWMRCGGAPWIGRPSSSIVPRAFTRPRIALIVLLFPAPLAPRMARISPAGTSRATRLTAGTAP